MAQGIVCKVWNVKGNSSKTTSSAVSDTINYIMNKEKTTAELKGTGMQLDSAGDINREVQYITNDLKTMDKYYVGGRLISDLDHATSEMMAVKRKFGKTGGRCALHGVISLDEADSSIENAPKLMLFANDVLKDLFPKNQAVFAVHTNTDNLHVHFVLNSVGLDGYKIHQPKNFVRDQMHQALIKYAGQYGFTINEQWLHALDYSKAMSFKEVKIAVRKVIDEAIEKSENIDEFKKNLEEAGWSVSLGAHLAMQNAYMPKARRADTILGKRYTPDAILSRIMHKRDDFQFVTVKEYVSECRNNKNMLVYSKPPKMEKFADMSKEEKRKIIKLLQHERNPWKEYYDQSWHFTKMMDKCNEESRVNAVIHMYAPNGNLQAAMNQIIEKKEQLKEEKKKISDNIKDNKPLIDLYKQAKQLQLYAYLYEYAKKEEYKEEYKQYKKLQERMNAAYNKSYIEVAEWYKNQQGELMYAKAQETKLSEDYKLIVKYGRKYDLISEDIGKTSIFDAVGFKKEEDKLKSTRIMDEKTVYITGKDESKSYLKVDYKPYMDNNWELKLAVVCTLYSVDGKKIDSVDSRDGIHEMNDWLHHLNGVFNYDDCLKMDNLQDIQMHLKNRKEAVSEIHHEKNTIENPVKENGIKESDRSDSEKYSKSFISAVDKNWAKQEAGVHYIFDDSNKNYYCAVETFENRTIRIDVFDSKSNVVETVNTTDGKNNNDSFKTLNSLQKKYNFSNDEILAITDPKEAMRLIQEMEHHEKTKKMAEVTDKNMDVKNVSRVVIAR